MTWAPTLVTWVLKATDGSKLANVLFTRELARRLGGHRGHRQLLPPRRGGHRGPYSALDGDTSGWSLALGFAEIPRPPVLLTPEEGARTPVSPWSAWPELASVSGQYFVGPKVRRPSRAARDPRAASRVWEVSRVMTGLAPADLPPDPRAQGASA